MIHCRFHPPVYIAKYKQYFFVLPHIKFRVDVIMDKLMMAINSSNVTMKVNVMQKNGLVMIKHLFLVFL